MTRPTDIYYFEGLEQSTGARARFRLEQGNINDNLAIWYEEMMYDLDVSVPNPLRIWMFSSARVKR